METFYQDLRIGARTLARAPGFTAIVIVTLALGIGANTAAFSLLNTLFFVRLPVPHADELVYASQARRGQPGTFPLSYADYLDYRDRADVFVTLAAHYATAPLQARLGDDVFSVNGSVVSASYFDTLEIGPEVGRFFRPDEDAASDRHPVVVLSDSTWRRRFGAEAAVLGRTLQLNGVPFQIVGVAPRGFEGVLPGVQASEVWIPAGTFHVGYRYCDAFARGCRIVTMIGRLKPGRTVAEAQADLRVIARQLEAEHPRSNSGLGVVVRSARGAVAGTDRTRAALLIAVAVAVVLLAACANVAGLVLARGWTRRREIAIRSALGAGRWRVTRQLLTESLWLSLGGAALGLLVAVWGNAALEAYYSTDNVGRRALFEIRVDRLVLAFTAAASLASGTLFGLAPALRASRTDVMSTLKDVAPSAPGAGQRLRDGLVVVQVALALALVMAAGLLVQSLGSVYHGPGFDPGPVVLLRLRPSLVDYGAARAWQFQREVIERLESLPGVVSASPAVLPPLQGTPDTPVWLPGQPPADPSHEIRAASNAVGPRYFATLGLPLVGGREFDERDRAGAAPVVILNETLARRVSPDRPVVGRSLVVGGQGCQVVGVVRDGQYHHLDEPPVPSLYLSYWQQDGGERFARDSRTHVRVEGDPRAMLSSLRQAVTEVDPAVPITEDQPLVDRLGYAFSSVRLAATAFVSFGGLALLLSAIGLYGTLALIVSRRARELALRRALGAESGAVIWLVVRRSAVLVLGGVVAGAGCVLVTFPFLDALLYGVGRVDPVSMVTATAILLLVAFAATWMPARRAVRVDPMVALRSE
jgi:predicted permease